VHTVPAVVWSRQRLLESDSRRSHRRNGRDRPSLPGMMFVAMVISPDCRIAHRCRHVTAMSR